MTTSSAAKPAVRAAFTQFIDYAGLFPPAKLEMAPALAEYASERRGAFAWMLGRFIVPASRIPELLAAGPEPAPLPLSVIIDAGAEPRAWLSNVQERLGRLKELQGGEPRIQIEALEIALPPLQTQRETYDAAIGQFAAARNHAGFDALPSFVELPRDDRWHGELDSALFALSRHRLGAKLRCGGVVPQAFPSTEEVAGFLFAAIGEHRVPVKATAGLHHPSRHLDEGIGAMMHGFLNLLAAAAFARAGMEPAQLRGIVECEDAAAFGVEEEGLRWKDRRVSTEDLQDVRSKCFISYGSCSFSEPVSDLQGLGIL